MLQNGLVRRSVATVGLATLALLGLGYSASAPAFIITAQLTGDPRPENPDNLVIDVTIKVGADASLADNQALWTIDINSPLHTNVKLDEFYFNMVGAASLYSFSDFDPTGWAVETPGTVQGGGSGTAEFLFQALDPSGPPNAADITNTQDLTFKMTKTSDFAITDFTLAPDWNSSNTTLGGGQLGAHLQSLTIGSCTTCNTDSGFALGNYVHEEEPVDPNVIPEPTTVLLLGAGLLGLGAARSRSKRATEPLVRR